MKELLAQDLTINGQTITVPGQISTVNNLAGSYGSGIIHLVIALLFFGAVLLTFVFVVYGGFKWMTSEGDKKKIEEARTTIIFAVIGIVVVVLASLIVNIIGAFFGVNLLHIGN